MAGRPEGFNFSERGDEVRIPHFGKPATILRGSAAQQFLADVESCDPQELMARVTG